MIFRQRRSRSELLGTSRAHLRQTKIKNFSVTPFGDEDVCRFHIAMNDAFRMRSIESIGNLKSEIKQTFDPQLAPESEFAKSLAFQKLHYDERPAIKLANLVNGANVRMI